MMTPACEPTERRRQRQCQFLQVDIYPVTCAELSLGRSDEEVLTALMAGGTRIVQLRDKHSPPQALLAKARRFRELTRAHGVLLIVNDHVDLARDIDADGVHLGQDDFPLAAARRLLPDQLLGASTHSLAEARRAAADGADYYNIGPIYPTTTKAGVSNSLGPEAIGAIAPHVPLPFTVMGGIGPANLDAVLAAGARRIAMVSAIVQAPDIAQRVRDLRARITAAGPSAL